MTRTTNHLQGQTSPYLLQHLHNPVDWHPWSDSALRMSRELDRPIFLSIGYSACHWCHVMERESFENRTIAAYLNEHFVPIKVDREERPDIDEIYMTAVQLLTRHGGWPLSVFLTPDLEPFFGGTYFPPATTGGRIGFLDVLHRIRDVWVTRRDEIASSSRELTSRLRTIADGIVADPGGEPVDSGHRRQATADLAERFDPRHGGFGGAPKFPPDQALAFLLREDARTDAPGVLDMVTTSLDRMALGGMYDHVGGGFARYSVDERWLVPHFEKMLYNQALLVPVYSDAWVATGRPLYRRVVEDTLDFVHREMTAPDGGFYSALDADSEGVEGKFYVWTPDQVREVLGASDGTRFCEVYDITPAGNFEGAGIPNLLRGDPGEEAHADLAPMRRALLDARGARVRPATDDKILTAWNGLMITALCRGYQVFGRDRDLRAAGRAADFILDRMWDGHRLRATSRGDGEGRLDAYLDDHAFLARGLLDLYESAFDDAHLENAVALGRAIVARFEDHDRGGFHFVADDHEALLTRTRSDHDGALPSGAGVATEVLLRLAAHLDDEPLRASARRSLASYRAAVDRAPSAYASLLIASSIAGCPEPEVAIVGPPDSDEVRGLVRVVHGRYPPVLALASSHEASDRPLLRQRSAPGASPAAFVCRDRVCERPVSRVADLARALD